MTEAFAQSHRFFALPLADKEAIAIETVGGNRGYSGLMHEALNPSAGPDRKEAFNVGFDLAPTIPSFTPASRSARSTPGRSSRVPRDAARLLRRLRRARGAPAPGAGARPRRQAGLFRRQVRSPDGDAAAPALSGARSRARTTRSAREPHTDYGNLTLLATDDVGGLEVRTRDGEWIEAPPLPGAFVVNIGDCLMRWTNDVYVSTPHRVVNRSGRERYSIAFFYDPNPDAEVAVIPILRRARRTRPLPARARGRLSEVPAGREQAGGAGR